MTYRCGRAARDSAFWLQSTRGLGWRTPAQERKTTNSEHQREMREHVPRVLPLQVAVERLLLQVDHVPPIRAPLPVHLLIQHPAEVRPVEALIGRVRVEWRLGVQVVVAMVRHPLDWPPLHRHRTTVGRTET